MIEFLFLAVLAVLTIAGSAVLGPKLGVAAPLVLVAVGIAASFLPVFADTHVDPEWILQGVLPPLLYSSAVSMPAMNFRRDFGAIGGLSVLLVVASALLLGVFFMLVIPDLGFAWGVALGAIISPTDAVATSIIKKTPVSTRVVTILDGESLLNDATALVLLRTAIVATAAGFAFWGALGTFVYSVVVAVVVGVAVGRIDLAIRRRVTDPTVNTVLSFTVPFVASVPAELLGGSGLVAAVVAGLITGISAPRVLSPETRLSDTQNWRAVELVLEGAVFLTMGVQIKEIVTHVRDDHAGVGATLLIALGALALTIVIRAAYVAPLLGLLQRWSHRNEKLQPILQDWQERLETPEGKDAAFGKMHHFRWRRGSPHDLERFSLRVTRGLADIDYLLREQLGWREGVAVVWAGMRGAVTVAAAQTLPEDTPYRSTLVLIAFAVAIISLLLQGGTIGPLLDRLGTRADDAEAAEQTAAQTAEIMKLLRTSAESVPPVPKFGDRPPSREAFDAAKKQRLAVLAAQRTALLDARDNGTFDADILSEALADLDATHIATQMHGEFAR